MKSIAIIRLSALGDVVLCVPAVRALQARYPEAKITWITSSTAYSLLKGLTGVEFIVIEKPKSIQDYMSFYQRLKSYHFDVLLCMQASFRTNLLYPLISSDRRIGFDNDRARDGHRWFVKEAIPAGRDHLLDAFMRFAVMLDAKPDTIHWDLDITDEDKQWAKQHLSLSSDRTQHKILAINPAASKQERCWFTERYIQVIQRAKQQWNNLEVVLTGGPGADEIALAAEIAKGVGFPVLNIVGKTTPKQLAAVLSEVDVLLSPDTGPLHIAVAMGKPVIGLYAVAPSALSGPYFSRELVIDKFDEAVRLLLKKDPKNIPWKTRVHTQKAMELITVDEVMEKLEKITSWMKIDKVSFENPDLPVDFIEEVLIAKDLKAVAEPFEFRTE